MNWILPFVINATSLLIADYLVEGIHIDSALMAILSALLLGIINTILKPIFTLISLPFIILTFGLFVLVINTMLLGITSLIIPGFSIDSFGAAFLGALIISLVSWLLNIIFADKN